MNKANIDEIIHGRKKNVEGGRIGYDQGGQLVDHGPEGVRQGYAGARYDNLEQGIKVGDRLGKNIVQEGPNQFFVQRGTKISKKGEYYLSEPFKSWKDAISHRDEILGKLKSGKKYIPEAELQKAKAFYANKFPDLSDEAITKKAKTSLYNIREKTGSYTFVGPDTTVAGQKTEKVLKGNRNKLRLKLIEASADGQTLYFDSLKEISKTYNVTMTDTEVSKLISNEFSDIVKLDRAGNKFRNYLKTKKGKISTSAENLLKEANIKGLSKAIVYRIASEFPNVALSGKTLYQLKKTQKQKEAFDLFLQMNPDKPYTAKGLAKILNVPEDEVMTIVKNMSVKAVDARTALGKQEKIISPAFKGITQPQATQVLRHLGMATEFELPYKRNIYNSLFKVYGNINSKSYDPSKFDESIELANKWFAFKKKVDKKFPGINFNLDHAFPWEAMNRAIRTEKLDPSEILRVRPIPGKLNSFKVSFDKKAIDLQKKLKNLAATNQRIPKELLEQKQAFEELGTQVFGKQYSIGKIGPSGKVIDWGAPKFGEEKLTTQAKKGLRLFERIQNIARNLPDNPDLQKLFQAAKIGTKGITALGQLRKFNPDAAIKFINELLIKNPGLRVELLGDEYADIKNYYADLGTTMTDAGMDIDFSLPPEKVPTETLPAMGALGIKYGKKALTGAGKFLAGIDLPPIQAALALTDPTTLAYTLPFSNLAAEQTGMYKPAKTKIGKVAKAVARGMPRKFAQNILPTISRASIPFSALYGVSEVAKASKPDYYIDPKTGDPTFYKREKAAQVMPTFIDIYEQASKIAQEHGIPYEEAVRHVNFDKFRNLNRLDRAGGGIANLTRTVAPDSGPMSQGLRSLYIDDMD